MQKKKIYDFFFRFGPFRPWDGSRWAGFCEILRFSTELLHGQPSRTHSRPFFLFLGLAGPKNLSIF